MADYDFTGKDEPAVLGSYNSYKGKRTTAARKLELLLDLQSKDYSAITSASINDCLKNCERIVEILAAQANWLLANKHAKAKDFIEETTAGSRKSGRMPTYLSRSITNTMWELLLQ